MFLEQTICICDPTHLSELADNASFLENLQTTCSSTAVGSMCQTVHATTAIIFGFLLLATLFQVLRFWFSVSDKFKANINFLYASFIAICSIRGIRYLALYFPSFLPSQLLHALLYAPIFLAFANQTVLFLTWFELFMIVSGKVKISQVKLWQRTIAATVVVLLSSILAFQYDSRYTSIPVLIGSIISIFLYVQHGLMKWKNAKVSKSGSRSRRFPLVTLLTTLSSVILLTISITVTAFSMASLFYDNHEIFFAKHSFWLFAELFFIFIQLATLNLFSVISILPLPTNSEILTNDWLTTLLREKSIISYDNSVKEYSGQKLSGGCHGKVRQIQLTYSDCSSGENYTAPKAIVVKTLSWDYNLLGKVSLSLRGQLGSYFETKATCYLKSYQIESHFYRDIAPSVKGIKLPMIYYNFEDKFNNQFGLVMEDVTYSDNPTHLPISGQPFGFTFEESRTILTQLAKFHAAFWDSKELRNYNIWDVGGYWTGDKRTSDKLKVVSQWKKSLENFAGQLLLPDEKCKKLAKRLYNNRHHLMSLYTNVNHETLIHGDFKIGNLFIDTNRTPVDFLRSNFPLPKTCTDSSDDEPSVNAIDWQWVGRGSCAIDVAYYLMTSTFPDVLNRRSLKKLVKVYHSILLAKGVQNFPFKEMWRQFQLSALDFFVYVISCKWSVLNLEKINENQQKCHDGMHIRSLSQMQQIIILAQEFVDELEFI